MFEQQVHGRAQSGRSATRDLPSAKLPGIYMIINEVQVWALACGLWHEMGFAVRS